MKTTLLDYNLPSGCIADRPTRVRRFCRLLRLDQTSSEVTHHRFADLPDLLARGDLLVVNDAAVIPARLIGSRSPSGGEAEIFLLEKVAPRRWRAMVRPGRRLRPGAIVTFGTRSSFTAHVDSAEENGTRMVSFTGRGHFHNWLKRYGGMPLPPYIGRPAEASDHRDYQTIFARRPGAVASPTAGLHFDQVLVDRLKRSGVSLATLTLHVGAGTFRPVRTTTIEEHHLEAESFRVGMQTQRRIRVRRKTGKGRVIAVGTTVTRALETVWRGEGDHRQRRTACAATRPQAIEGRTDLLITPGYQFRAIDGLITNFHLPRSSLLALVAAFAGLEPVMRAYRIAMESGYRFYSYGDAMLII